MRVVTSQPQSCAEAEVPNVSAMMANQLTTHNHKNFRVDNETSG